MWEQVVEVDVLCDLLRFRISRSARDRDSYCSFGAGAVPFAQDVQRVLNLSVMESKESSLGSLSIGLRDFLGQGDIWGIGPSLIKRSWLIALAMFGKVKVWVMPMSSPY